MTNINAIMHKYNTWNTSSDSPSKIREKMRVFEQKPASPPKRKFGTELHDTAINSKILYYETLSNKENAKTVDSNQFKKQKLNPDVESQLQLIESQLVSELEFFDTLYS
jgi:hypothetical protein